jgi:hypothetical protein
MCGLKGNRRNVNFYGGAQMVHLNNRHPYMEKLRALDKSV